MTLHELLEKISFDELLPHLLRYDKRLRGVASFKTHYDILRHLSPIDDEDFDLEVEFRTDENDGIIRPNRFDGFGLEENKWPISLAKSLVLDGYTSESFPAIAAACIWHTSFYGFNEENLQKTRERFSWSGDDPTPARVRQLFGPYLPSYKKMLAQPSFHADISEYIKRGMRRRTSSDYPYKRRKEKRLVIRSEYKRRISMTGSFLEDLLYHPPLQTAPPSEETMRRLLCANRFAQNAYQSYTWDGIKRLEYLQELNDKYLAFYNDQHPHALLCMSASEEHPVTETEREWMESIARTASGDTQCFLKTDNRLGVELKLNVAFYE